jgi:SAM-dependent methyltransferase
MKLQELVSLRNELQKAIDLSVIRDELAKNSTNLVNLTSTSDPEYGTAIEEIAEQHSKIITYLEADTQRVQQLINEINLDIHSLSSKFFEENYQTELRYTNPENIRKVRVMRIPEGVDLLLKNRINIHSTWKYPALEIGCRDGEWTKHLVASDPLYIADIHNDFFDSTCSQFTPEYQARIRKYLIQDYKIYGLPKNQFGFIFSYNFFNYLSFDSIKQYLKQSFDWLRPGGSMIFTYNNADLPAAAALAESYFMTYVPKSMLVPMCESMGYEVVMAQDFEPSTSWIEIRKPGILKTVKAHQVMCKIVHFNN